MHRVKGLGDENSCDGAVTGESDRHEINQCSQRDVQVRIGLAVDTVPRAALSRAALSSTTGKTRFARLGFSEIQVQRILPL